MKCHISKPQNVTFLIKLKKLSYIFLHCFLSLLKLLWQGHACISLTKCFFFFLGISFFKKMCFIDYAITVVPNFLLISLCPTPSLPPSSLPLSSCPWVVHKSSLAPSFPILFLTSPCLFCTYHLCFLFLVTLLPSSPFSSLLITLRVISNSVILFLF